ncbi:GNAT family N-acetyltransferase [Nostoc sp.]|uniref:GNAT family N-acetyltransferase n=1 Tax=Nostoc sp. TaxID=1180 RepID=UPI002FF4B3DA
MNLPLETERLILRDFVESDWPAVHQYASDREVVRYLTFGPNNEEDTKKFLQANRDCITRRKTPSTFCLSSDCESPTAINWYLSHIR